MEVLSLPWKGYLGVKAEWKQQHRDECELIYPEVILKRWINPYWALCFHNLDASSMAAYSGVYAQHRGWVLAMLGVPVEWDRKAKQQRKGNTQAWSRQR